MRETVQAAGILATVPGKTGTHHIDVPRLELRLVLEHILSSTELLANVQQRTHARHFGDESSLVHPRASPPGILKGAHEIFPVGL